MADRVEARPFVEIPAVLDAIARGSETEARAPMEAHLRQVETVLARSGARTG